MSKYTTEVRWICESKSGFTLEELSSKSVDEIIAAAWDQIFDFTMPFSSEWNEKIAKFLLKYYYTREIGFETVGLWKLKVNTRLEEIAGTYLPMIAAADALTAADLTNNYKYNGSDTRTDNLTNQRTDNLTENNEGNSRNRFSDTPQNGLAIVENGQYLSNYTYITDENERRNTGTQTVTDTGTQTHVYQESGYKGPRTVAEIVSETKFRELNVLQKIAEEFTDLFFLLW